MNAALDSIAETYANDGFVFPVDVVPEAKAKAVRADLERAEAECADDPEKLALVRSYPDRLIPSFDALVRNERLVEAVKPILGPDLMVWSSGLRLPTTCPLAAAGHPAPAGLSPPLAEEEPAPGLRPSRSSCGSA